jgi:hypothetical protein
MYVPNWYYIHGVAIMFATGLLYLNWYMPESPKYMYVNRRFDETREILKIVASKNGAKITPMEISEILFEFEGIEDDN